MTLYWLLSFLGTRVQEGGQPDSDSLCFMFQTYLGISVEKWIQPGCAIWG